MLKLLVVVVAGRARVVAKVAVVVRFGGSGCYAIKLKSS